MSIAYCAYQSIKDQHDMYIISGKNQKFFISGKRFQQN